MFSPEQINQLLKYAIAGYWSALQEKCQDYEFISTETKELLAEQLNLQTQFQEENQILTNPRSVGDYMRIKKELTILQVKIAEVETELQTERETTQQALQTSQTWHERQKAEIIAEWKQKLTNFLNTRKAQAQQELTLIREVLND